MLRYDIIDRIQQSVMTPPGKDHSFVVSRTSYLDVYRMANSILDALSSRSPSAVCLYTEDKSIIAAALLAALAGGFSLVLPHTDSQALLTEIRDNLEVPTVITDRARPLPASMQPILPEANCPAAFDHPLRLHPDQELCAFYTGGSTGAPQKWSKSLRNLLAEALYHAQAFAVSSKDLILSTVPAHHIYGFLFTVLIPLVAKASLTPRICSFPEEIRHDMAGFHPSILVSIPVHYRALRTCQFMDTSPSLRMALSSAGVLDARDAASFYQQTRTHVTEIFGSTETGGIAIRSQSRGEQAFTAFSAVDWKIASPPEQRLLVRSPFLPPWAATDAHGFFQTGDRATACTDNAFFLLGRADGIVKVAGKRVDLDLVQAKLKTIEGVEDAVVVPMPKSNSRQTEICAFIQSRLDRTYIQDQAARLLEPWSRPRRMRILEKIPTSAAGKYNRQALLDLLTPSDASSY
ncbi:MAG: AMP-binding protein [Thermodesulfobacteriota bacterium]